jgi:hypothetical protein
MPVPLLTEAVIDFLTVGPGDGNDFPADMGAMMFDLIDFVERKGIGAMDPKKFFRGEFGGYVGEGLMTEILAGRCDYTDIVFEALNV